jgi:hypothetical protein
MMKRIKMNIEFSSNKFTVALLILILSICISCRKESPLPILETKVANVFGTSATTGGTIITRKSAAIHETGVCWSTNKTPDINDAHTLDGINHSVFVSVMEGLTPGKDYYYRAYAISSEGVAYGNTLKLKTKSDNSSFLQIDSIKFLTLRTAKAYASLNYPGDSYQIQRRGFCYSDHPLPTISDAVVDRFNSTSTQGFVSTISFNTGGTFYVRSFIELKNGNVYYAEPLSVKPGRLEITTVDRITFRSVRIIIENDPHPQTHYVQITHPHYNFRWSFYEAGATTYRTYLSGLNPDSTYHVSAWLRYSGDLNWFEDFAGTVNFTTLPLPDIGNGTYQDPYSVDGALYHTSFPGHVWLEGYIVGEYDTYLGNFNPPFSFEDNILIGGDGEEAFRRNTVQINLPQGPIREALNLKDNPENKGAKLKIHGKVYHASHAVVMTEIQGFELE